MIAECARCRAPLPAGVRFCPACGMPTSGEPGGQERKLVTVLFADVVGSTRLSERLDEERLKDVMDAYFEAMRTEIESEGGTVEKFIGDAVMAVFGVPAAHEDDARRALRASLQMRRALSELNRSLLKEHGLSLAMRVGINTGDVVAAIAPRPGEPLVTGKAVNVAARLEQAAEAGQILVSERTARAAGPFRLVETGPLSLKGWQEAVHAYQLLEAEREDEPGVPRLQAPMVGREAELAVLRTVFQRVAAQRVPHLVTIYGDAGVGKSRLIEELTVWASQLDPPPLFVRGRCLPYGRDVTYWPLAEILKRHAGVLDTDLPQQALGKIRKAFSEVLLEEMSADPGRTIASLCFTVGLGDPEGSLNGLEPRQIRLELDSAWRLFFSALARARPTLVLIEDTHWADPAMLDLLEELADHAEGPLLFLCPARRELTGRRPGWAGGRWNCSSLLLEPLDAPDADRLLGLLVSADLPPGVSRRILERAGGNPFFLEEILRHLIDQRHIVPSGSGWATPDESETVQIPDTVQGVLAARMDLLQPREKRALQLAAVVGREFWSGPLREAFGSDGDLDDILGRLEERGLVVSRLTSSVSGDREYVFRHILTRDVAYESLPRRDRARAHAMVGQWIEDSAGERLPEFLDLLAHHYGEAHRVMVEQRLRDAGRIEVLRRKAFTYALLASESARRKLVLQGAQSLAETARSLAEGPVERSDALEMLGRAYFLQAEGDLAWECLKEAVDLRLSAGTPDGGAIARLSTIALEVATRGRGTMRSRLSGAEVRPYLEIARSHVQRNGGEDLTRLLIAESFWPFSFREEPPTERELHRARRAGEEAAARAIRAHRPDLASAALDGVGSSYICLGLYGQMDPIVERRLELAGSVEDPWELGDIFAVAAWCGFHIGRYRKALSLADEGFERSVRGAPSMALHCLDWRALARYRLGDWEGFFSDVHQADELFGGRKETPPSFAADHVAVAALIHEIQDDQPGADRVLGVVEWLQTTEGPASSRVVWLALLMGRRGQHEEAERLLGGEDEDPRYLRGLILEAKCDLLGERSGWDEAAGLVAEARRHAAEAGLSALPLFADRLEARAAIAGGDAQTARTLLDRARAGFLVLGARWEGARCSMDLAEVLGRTGDLPSARHRLEEAKTTFERVRSARELKRADELLERLN